SSSAASDGYKRQVELPGRAFQIWDEAAGGWSHRPGRYEVRAARSAADPRLTLALQED
ncbi:hypothetical protein HET66_14810, partial [Streptomyces sp. McG6]|nr:hypothetical protein [Streptomyces sp. McG6]